MKHRELIRLLEHGVAVFIRHGGKHPLYQKPVTKICQSESRHSEIKEFLARAVTRKLAGDTPDA